MINNNNYILNNKTLIFLILFLLIQTIYFFLLFFNIKKTEDKTKEIIKKEEKLENLLQSLYLYSDSINFKLIEIESKKNEIVNINNTYVQKSNRIYNLNPEDSYLLFTKWLSQIDTIRRN